jgi:hypothetical protein
MLLLDDRSCENLILFSNIAQIFLLLFDNSYTAPCLRSLSEPGVHKCCITPDEKLQTSKKTWKDTEMGCTDAKIYQQAPNDVEVELGSTHPSRSLAPIASAILPCIHSDEMSHTTTITAVRLVCGKAKALESRE